MRGALRCGAPSYIVDLHRDQVPVTYPGFLLSIGMTRDSVLTVAERDTLAIRCEPLDDDSHQCAADRAGADSNVKIEATFDQTPAAHRDARLVTLQLELDPPIQADIASMAQEFRAAISALGSSSFRRMPLASGPATARGRPRTRS